MLCDLRTGVAAVFREFRTLKFKGKKHEASDLHKLLGKYAEWAHAILPAVDFSDFVQKLDKLGGNAAVRSRISFLRDVQQGLASLDDLQEIEDNYNAHRVDEFGLPLDDDAPDLGPSAALDDDDDDWHVGSSAAHSAGASATAAMEAAARTAARAEGPVTVTAEQVERMARNRQIAIERAAALRAQREGGAAAPAAGGAAGAEPAEDEFPEEEGYPDEDDEINDDDEAMAAEFGDLDDEFDAPAEHPAQHARHVAERAAAAQAAAAQAETAAYGCAETGAEELDAAGTRAAEAETEAYGAMETQAATEAEAEPVSAADAAAMSSMDAALADTAGDAAERRAQALADAMDMEEGDL